MGISRYVDTVYWYFVSVARKVKNNNTHFTVQFLFTQNFIIFMQFFEKIGTIICWHPAPGQVVPLDPPPFSCGRFHYRGKLYNHVCLVWLIKPRLTGWVRLSNRHETLIIALLRGKILAIQSKLFH